jgi:beta-galactosidase GanA
MTINRYGRGAVIYVGTESPADGFYNRLVRLVAQRADLILGPKLPTGVEMATRQKSGEKIIFLLNYTGKPESVEVGATTRNALSGQAESDNVQVPPYDVRVLTER